MENAPVVPTQPLVLVSPIDVTQLVRRAPVGVPLRISRDGLMVDEHTTASGDKNADWTQATVPQHVIEHGARQ